MTTEYRKVHVLLGNPGYPVLMLSSREAFRLLTVEHAETDIAIGDAMVIGPSAEASVPYVVTANARVSPSRWKASLERIDFVAVAGETYHRPAQPS